MNNFSPQIPLPVNLSGGGSFNRKATPGDIGDSLFEDFLQKVNGQDDEGIPAWLPLALSGNEAGGGKGGASSAEAGGAGKGLEALGLGAGRVMLSSGDLSKLARILEQQGFSPRAIQGLFQSLGDKNGDIRLDRLFAKLQTLFQERSDSASSSVVDRSDVPRLEEALFKMGLGAGEVREAVEKSKNADGNLSVERFVRALRDLFPDLTVEMEKRIQAVLQQETGIRFRPGDLQKTVRDAGLEAELHRLTGNASEAARNAAKREIAALMQEKGVPLEDVKRFLESLRIQRAGLQAFSRVGGLEDAGRQRSESAPGESPSVRVYIRRDRTDWEQGGWKQRILDILNRQEALAGRKTGPEAGAGKAGSFRELAGMLEEALSGRTASGKAGEKPGPMPFPWAEGKPPAAGGRAAPDFGHAEQASSKPGAQRQGAAAESTPSRSPSGAEVSLPRADRAAAAQQASPVKATAASANLPEPLPKIVDRMVWMVRAGEQTSRIQISPPELGRLDLDIVIRQGHLHANLHAENPAVKELIEANLQQLRQQLSNLGFVVERFEVAAGLTDRRFSENQAQFGGRKGRNGQGRASAAGTEDDSAEAVRSSDRSHSGRYRIDVHV